MTEADISASLTPKTGGPALVWQALYQMPAHVSPLAT